MAVPQWLQDFCSGAENFRKVLIERPHLVTGLTQEERQRLINLSDEELEREMNAHLDLSRHFME